MEEKPKHEGWYIGCPRFGGSRFSLSCAHLDRRKGCRRYCATLKKKMEERPDFIESMKEVYKESPSTLPSKYSGKGLPIQPFQCDYCGFVAKSDRGLKSHITKSHMERKREKKESAV
jgi:predicted Zn-ribbon and HTH transcriptional regulator